MREEKKTNKKKKKEKEQEEEEEEKREVRPERRSENTRQRTGPPQKRCPTHDGTTKVRIEATNSLLRAHLSTAVAIDPRSCIKRLANERARRVRPSRDARVFRLPREKQPKKEKPHKERKTPASIFSNTGVYSVPGKVRWQPTTAQFERLEQLFAIDTTTPQRENLKQVTEELSALGPIQECNVYNWFQNKKARLKKREQDAARERMEEEMRAKADQYNAQQQQMGNLS